MNYYDAKQYVAQIDEHDTILGAVEKWEAHRKSILHRAFTVILTHKKQYVLQHRKHPVFDGCFDLSFSSHQLYEKGKLQPDLDAIYSSLIREWNIEKDDLVKKPQKIGQIYYEEKDPGSDFSDHEIDYIYTAELKTIPSPNYDYAYGFSLVEKKDLQKRFRANFAPWVRKMIKEGVM